MRKISNPYKGQEGYICFGCSPDNSFGLRMNFYEDGEAIFCDWNPQPHFQGYRNILHGGIQASLMDEVAAWAVSVKLGSTGLTSRLEIKYKKPVFVHEGKIKLRARIVKFEKRLASIQTELFNSKGVSCAEGLVDYFVVAEEKARKDYFYPGKEKFFSNSKNAE